jgi:superfamily II DNA or RNA helicase
MYRLEFERGTLVLNLPPNKLPAGLEYVRFDDRVKMLRAPAYKYRPLLVALKRAGIEVEDTVRAYQELPLKSRIQREPYPHQLEAIASWKQTGCRGNVVLPTGSGKTFVAELAIEATGRSTFVVVPTIDLMGQWYDLLSSAFGKSVGLLGGGSHEIKDITVSTYASAHIYVEHYGARFGLVIFDESHHLPGSSYVHAAEGMIAPFRLGLTATPPLQEEERYAVMEEVIGKFCYTKQITALAGNLLAEYEVATVPAALSPEELQSYQDNRKTYRDFVVSKQISMGDPKGWGRFIQLSSRSEDGRRAFRAYREQRRIALFPQAKIDIVEDLLWQHRDESSLIFTEDNESAYTVGKLFLLPVITHQTPPKERKEILDRYRAGQYKTIVTAKVLNEGVDLPAASVGIIVAGSGSTREHVQRLGRILRRGEGKRAILYELLTEGTLEQYVSGRRREHDAYRDFNEPTEGGPIAPRPNQEPMQAPLRNNREATQAGQGQRPAWGNNQSNNQRGWTNKRPWNK